MPYRVLTLASGTTPLMPWLLDGLGPRGAWEPWVEMHPETASELGVGSTRRIRVVSDHGSFTARLHVFEGAQPGLLNVPYGLHSSVGGWGSFEPFNPLSAVGALRDPLSGLPDWYSTRARVEAA
jgi:anaerobic selenocysteine-containing dehydrogenase